MEMNFAKRGVANAGLTTGIIGTSLGALSILGGLGNVLGGVNPATAAAIAAEQTGENTPVNRYDLSREQEIAKLRSDLALRDANTYNDQKMLEMYKYIDGKLNEIGVILSNQAVQNQATKDSFQLVTERLAAETSARKCADNSIVNYINATFYPKQVADVTTGTTTTAQALYNPLPVECCG